MPSRRAKRPGPGPRAGDRCPVPTPHNERFGDFGLANVSAETLYTHDRFDQTADQCPGERFGDLASSGWNARTYCLSSIKRSPDSTSVLT